MQNSYYLVTTSRDYPHRHLRDHHFHGFETADDYARALRKLQSNFAGRIGEAIALRHGLLRLRFWDTPGGKPDEAWFPRFLLTPTDRPDFAPLPPHLQPKHPTIEEQLDEAYGFD